MRGQSCSTSLLGTALVALSLLVVLTTAQPSVTVDQGVVVGTTEIFQEDKLIGLKKYIDVFKGIPFAEPPVGSLRFMPPVEKKPWAWPYDATYFRAACMQDPSSAKLVGLDTLHEDCLHLNIYAPNPKVPGGAAVMVFIHGGGFTFGSAIESVYNGVPLAAVGDVTVVTVNYRLSVFGYLSTADEASPGNVGLLDLVEALRWINKNIEAFGGDSERITIFGESAGAYNVDFLILSEMAKGLFNQAILQSGTAFGPDNGPFNAETGKLHRQQAFQIGQILGCSSLDTWSLIWCMQYVDAKALLQVAEAVAPPMYPVVDGTFIKDTPANLYSTGNFNRVKILLGTNSDEGTYFVLSDPRFADYSQSKDPPPFPWTTFEALLADTSQSFHAYDDKLLNAIRMKYIDWSQAEYQDADYFRAYVDLLTDWLFACATDQLARVHAQWGDEVFLYQMTHSPSIKNIGPDWVGASHSEDLPFVFGIPFIPGSPSSYMSDTEKAFSVKFMKLWTNFAKSGNPGLEAPNSQPISDEYSWPPFSSPDLEYKVLDLNLTTSRALKANECYFWNDYVVKLRRWFTWGNPKETEGE